MALNLRNLVQTLPKLVTFFSKSPYSRGRGKGVSFQISKADHFAVKDELENVEAIEDFFNREGRILTSGKQLRRDTETLIQSGLKRQQEWLKKKIIQRKYFKERREVNLLTWAAKEQICYLNQQFPDEWTPEILAEHFPVTKKGVILLLKSRYLPRSQEDIVKHDKNVLRNWQQLKDMLQLQGGPVDVGSYQHSLNQVPLMINAAGASHLPRPCQAEQRICSNTQQRKRKLGAFEAIVAGSVPERQQEKNICHQQSKQQQNLVQKHIKDFLILDTKSNDSDRLKLSHSDRHSKPLDGLN